MMNAIELYDILTIEDKEFIISSFIEYNHNQYFLLNEIDENENPLENVKIVKRSLGINLEPDKLYPVLEEEELVQVKDLLLNAMLDDIKEVE